MLIMWPPSSIMDLTHGSDSRVSLFWSAAHSCSSKNDSFTLFLPECNTQSRARCHHPSSCHQVAVLSPDLKISATSSVRWLRAFFSTFLLLMGLMQEIYVRGSPQRRYLQSSSKSRTCLWKAQGSEMPPPSLWPVKVRDHYKGQPRGLQLGRGHSGTGQQCQCLRRC